MAYVVVDTNLVGGAKARPLESTDLRRLVDETRRDNLTLALPEIVVLEAANLWAEQIRDEASHYQAASRKLVDAGLLVTAAEGLSVDIDAIRADEAKRIRLTVTSAGGITVPLPTRPHRELVERALERRQPFDSKGRNGYRDVLLWESVLDLVESNRPVILIARDKAAFFERGDASSGLAAALRGEVRERCSADSVELFFELADGIARALEMTEAERHQARVEQAAADSEALSRLNRLLAEDQSFSALVADSLDEALRYWDIAAELDAFGIPDADAYEARIDIVDTLRNLEFVSAHVASDGAVLTEIEAEFEATADLSLHPSNATMLEDHPKVRIYDFGYGTPKAEGVVDIQGLVTADVVVDLDAGTLASLMTVSRLTPPDA